MKTTHHTHASPCATSRARHTSSTHFLTKLLAASAVSLFILMLAAPNAEAAGFADKLKNAAGAAKEVAKAKEAEAKATAPTTTANTGATTAATASVKKEDSVPTPVTPDTQDNVLRIKGFDIEFYKKLNPDDFSATDVAALRKLFADIHNQTASDKFPQPAGGDYRTFKLTVIEEPRRRPFEDLNAAEGAKGGAWYTGARWRVNLHENGLNDYLTVIVPKLRAVLSKVAVRTSEQDVVYTAKISEWNPGTACLQLEPDRKKIEIDPFPDDGKIRITLAIPGTPEKLLNPKAGDKMAVKYVSYDLPTAFGSAIAHKSNNFTMQFHQHVSAKNGTYLGSHENRFQARPPYAVGHQQWLFYDFPMIDSSGDPTYLDRDFIIQVDGQCSTFHVKDDNYGGCLVSFRWATDIFPDADTNTRMPSDIELNILCSRARVPTTKADKQIVAMEKLFRAGEIDSQELAKRQRALIAELEEQARANGENPQRIPRTGLPYGEVEERSSARKNKK